MPRAKAPKKKPVETFDFDNAGEKITVEVWNNRADEGTRGAHKLKLHDDVFNIVLETVDSNLNDISPTLKGTYERLVDGRFTRAEFGRIIIKIAKANKLKIGKTLSEEIASDIRKHYQACKNALEKKASEEKDKP